MHLTTDGIVLRDTRLNEDRLLTILTQEHGLVTAFVNKASRLRNKLASSTELLCYSHFVLFKSRDRYQVDKADANRIFFGLRENLDALALASYLAELAAELAPRGEACGEFLRLLLNCLHFLEKRTRDRRQIKAIFELRALTLSGYMPNLVACCECGCYECAEMLFDPAQSHLLCGTCLGGLHAAPPTAILVGTGVLASMRHIVYAAPDKLFAFSLSDAGLTQLAHIAETYVKYQLERTFPTLEFYTQLQIHPE